MTAAAPTSRRPRRRSGARTDGSPVRLVSASTDISVTLVSGRLSRPVERRTLPSGDTLLVLELTSRNRSGPAESVPVVWPEGPAWADALTTGDRVVVVGRVRRRFFQFEGRTGSRTEVVAERVVPERKRARVRAAVEVVRRRVDALDDEPTAGAS
jgi:single-stranded DNA-binding protein